MIIYLDIDGVLAQCQVAALNYFGHYFYEYPFGKRVKDILAEYDEDFDNQTYHQFWSEFDEVFWQLLLKTNECDFLIETCVEAVGRENVFLASRPTMNPGSYSGKAEWVQQNLPKYLHNQLILIHNKSLLAKPNTLLIDDTLSNCNAFTEAGGNSLFVKRPWNGHKDITCKELSCQIDAFVL